MSGQPPPNFNATESVLHVPPAAAHIRIEPVQGGGGMVGGNTEYNDADLQTLREYGLAEGGALASQFDEQTKRAFLDQLGNCIGAGTKTIRDTNCWAVSQVLRALNQRAIQQTNLETPSRKMSVVSPRQPLGRGIRLRPASPPYVPSAVATAGTVPQLPGTPTTPLSEAGNNTRPANVNTSSIVSNNTSSVLSNDTQNTQYVYDEADFEINPKNYKGNNSGYGTLRQNFKKGNVFSNAKIGTRRVRIHGKNATNIQKKYNAYRFQQLEKSVAAEMAAKQASEYATSRANLAKRTEELQKKVKEEKRISSTAADYARLESEISSLESKLSPLTFQEKTRLRALKAKLAVTPKPSAQPWYKRMFGQKGGKSRRASRKSSRKNRKTRKNRK
jgi:hypothetical protein